MGGEKVYGADRSVVPAEQRKVVPPAEFSLNGISFTIAADRPDGVSIHFTRKPTEPDPGLHFSESVLLLSVENLGDGKKPGIVSRVFARPAPKEKSATSASYSVGVVYKDNSELLVTVRAAANGNGVVLDYGEQGKKAYFFGNISSQLSDFMAGTEYANEFKIESSGGILSVTGYGKTMALEVGPVMPVIYAEYSGKGGFVSITNTPPGYRMDPPYGNITITPNMMKRYFIASE